MSYEVELTLENCDVEEFNKLVEEFANARLALVEYLGNVDLKPTFKDSGIQSVNIKF